MVLPSLSTRLSHCYRGASAIVGHEVPRVVSRAQNQTRRQFASQATRTRSTLQSYSVASDRYPQHRAIYTSAPRTAQATSTPPSTSTSTTSAASKPTPNLKTGLSDSPLNLDEGADTSHDWTRSFHGLSAEPFSKEAADVLTAPLPMEDIEIKPDGIIYLPEIKYRRILNKAFGPGGWGLAPRGESIVTAKAVTREYALVAHGRYVDILYPDRRPGR